MKTEFRVTAKTVSEAYTKAIELYSSLGEISYEVETEGKKGFLGVFGRVDAVIKVTVDDGREEKKPKNQTQGAPTELFLRHTITPPSSSEYLFITAIEAIMSSIRTKDIAAPIL